MASLTSIGHCDLNFVYQEKEQELAQRRALLSFTDERTNERPTKWTWNKISHLRNQNVNDEKIEKNRNKIIRKATKRNAQQHRIKNQNDKNSFIFIESHCKSIEFSQSWNMLSHVNCHWFASNVSNILSIDLLSNVVIDLMEIRYDFSIFVHNTTQILGIASHRRLSICFTSIHQISNQWMNIKCLTAHHSGENRK